MNPKKELVLNSADVCSILDACMKSGVVELKFGPLDVRFGKQTERSDTIRIEKDLQAAPATAIADPPDHNKESNAALVQEELRTREDEIAELLITNPLMAEELIRDGELEEDDGTESAE